MASVPAGSYNALIYFGFLSRTLFLVYDTTQLVWLQLDSQQSFLFLQKPVSLSLYTLLFGFSRSPAALPPVLCPVITPPGSSTLPSCSVRRLACTVMTLATKRCCGNRDRLRRYVFSGMYRWSLALVL